MIHSPLEAIHESLDARLTEFAGWNMPLWYSGALDEHHAVRSTAGLFDLTHMGELSISGPQAGEALNYALISHLSAIEVGQAKYTMLCNADGMIIDDLVVYRRDDNRYMVVANASNSDTVAAVLTKRLETFDATLDDQSLATTLIAIQGPASAAIVGQLTDTAVTDLPYYRGVDTTAVGVPAYAARTGYTGEDGFEIYIDNDHAEALWQAATEAGAAHGIVPAGLACRDTLRLEAGMPLYGNELTLQTSPLDTRSSRLIAWDKPGDFVGRDALEALKDQPHQRLVGVVVEGKRPARADYPVISADGDALGVITSGTVSPTLDHPVAMARLLPGVVPEGTKAADLEIHVDVRGTVTPAKITKLPFYKRAH